LQTNHYQRRWCISRRLTIKPKVLAMDDGGFHAQHAALFVIDLDRVAVDRVPQPHPLGTLLQTARHLAFKVGMDVACSRHRMTQKAQEIDTLEGADPVMQTGAIHARDSRSVLVYQSTGIT